MQICLAIMAAAKRAGLLAGGDGKDGTYAYTVINARDPIHIMIRASGRATISTVQSDQEHNFTLEDEDDHVELFVKLSEMLIEENLDSQANKLLAIIKGYAKQADLDVGDEFADDEDGSDDEEAPAEANFDDEDDDETVEEASVPRISFRDPAVLDDFERVLASAAAQQPSSPAVASTVSSEEEVAASALIASSINLSALSAMLGAPDTSRFQIMAALADQVGHHSAKAIFDAVQAIHIHNGILPAGVGEMADNWTYKLLGYVAEIAGPVVLAEVRGALISLLPLN